MKRLRNPVFARVLTAAFLVFALPAAVLYWLLPYFSGITLGQDYTVHALIQQIHLMFFLKSGSFPLFIPGFAGGGQSFAALTQAYLFHPLTHLAALVPGYGSGQALEIYTLFNLMSLGISHAVLFFFLRHLGLRRLYAFALSFITVYNMRMIDLFRYGGSLQNYNTFLWLSAALLWFCIKPGSTVRALFVIGTTYLLVCGGHTQMTYYALIGTGCVTLLAPFYMRNLLPESPGGFTASKYYLAAAACITAGVLLASMHLFPFYYDFAVTNAGRVGRDMEWGLGDGSFGSFFNALFRPFQSNLHGAFAGSALAAIPFLFPLIFFFKKPRGGRTGWALWLLLISILGLTLSRPLPLYRIFWHLFPFASAFRVPERLHLLTPLLSMLLFVWLIRLEPMTWNRKGRTFSLSPVVLMSLAAALLYLVMPALPASGVTPDSIRPIPEWVRLTVFFSGILSLIAMAICAQTRRSAVFGAILIATLLLQTGAVLRFATWTTPKTTLVDFAALSEAQNQKPAYTGPPMEGMTPDSTETYVRLTGRDLASEPLARLVWNWKSAATPGEAEEFLTKEWDPSIAVIETTAPSFEIPATKNNPLRAVVQILAYSNNRFTFRSYSPLAGYFVLAFPYSGHWQANLNGRPCPIYRADRAKLAVHVKGGTNIIEFVYRSPAALLGMAISGLTLWLIGCWALFRSRRRYTSLGAIILLAAVLMVYQAWYSALYTGKNYTCGYLWKAETTGGKYKDYIYSLNDAAVPETRESGSQTPK